MPDMFIPGVTPQTPHPMGGEHYKIKFPNGYGASIIKNRMSYGYNRDLYELAILKNGRICYNTSVAIDVLGYLTPEDVNQYLRKIEALPKA